VDASGPTASTAYRSTKGTRLTYARRRASSSFVVELRERRRRCRSRESFESRASEVRASELCDDQNPANRDDPRADWLDEDDATGAGEARRMGRPRNARGRSRAAARNDISARAERRSIERGRARKEVWGERAKGASRRALFRANQNIWIRLEAARDTFTLFLFGRRTTKRLLYVEEPS
jgi:hypothetical protein